MRNLVNVWVLMASLISLNTWAGEDPEQWSGQSRQLVLNAKGEAQAYACEIPPTDLGTTQALCFDVPLFHPETGFYVGMMQDTLADVETPQTGSVIATATSTFTFSARHDDAAFTTRVRGQVQPLLLPSSQMTHMTSYIPEPGENNILSGNGCFSGFQASARESGAVNLTRFTGQVGDVIGYDLIWVISRH